MVKIWVRFNNEEHDVSEWFEKVRENEPGQENPALKPEDNLFPEVKQNESVRVLVERVTSPNEFYLKRLDGSHMGKCFLYGLYPESGSWLEQDSIDFGDLLTEGDLFAKFVSKDPNLGFGVKIDVEDLGDVAGMLADIVEQAVYNPSGVRPKTQDQTSPTFYLNDLELVSLCGKFVIFSSLSGKLGN